ncbi:MAG: helix-turn-helix domain-containing protein [Microthrixaceae bacterium]
MSVSPKVERKRRAQMRRFADASLDIVASEGLAALTMARLAEELGTVPSAMYRYFPSKAALITAVQRDAIERLSESFALTRDAVESGLAEGRNGSAGFDDRDRIVVRLVLFGRWFCAAYETHLEEIRLLQMIMSDQPNLDDPRTGLELLPVAMVLLSQAAAQLDAGEQCGLLTPASSMQRAIAWAAALGGALETDLLEALLPELLGGTRVARMLNLDLLRGWGIPDASLRLADRFVDEFAGRAPLAPAAPLPGDE